MIFSTGLVRTETEIPPAGSCIIMVDSIFGDMNRHISSRLRN